MTINVNDIELERLDIKVFNSIIKEVKEVEVVSSNGSKKTEIVTSIKYKKNIKIVSSTEIIGPHVFIFTVKDQAFENDAFSRVASLNDWVLLKSRRDFGLKNADNIKQLLEIELLKPEKDRQEVGYLSDSLEMTFVDEAEALVFQKSIEQGLNSLVDKVNCAIRYFVGDPSPKSNWYDKNNNFNYDGLMRVVIWGEGDKGPGDSRHLLKKGATDIRIVGDDSENAYNALSKFIEAANEMKSLFLDADGLQEELDELSLVSSGMNDSVISAVQILTTFVNTIDDPFAISQQAMSALLTFLGNINDGINALSGDINGVISTLNDSTVSDSDCRESVKVLMNLMENSSLASLEKCLNEASFKDKATFSPQSGEFTPTVMVGGTVSATDEVGTIDNSVLTSGLVGTGRVLYVKKQGLANKGELLFIVSDDSIITGVKYVETIWQRLYSSIAATNASLNALITSLGAAQNSYSVGISGGSSNISALKDEVLDKLEDLVTCANDVSSSIT